MLGAIGRLAFVFTPLPGFERIPIRVVFGRLPALSSGGFFAGGLRDFLVFARIDGGDDFLFFEFDFVLTVVGVLWVCLGGLIQQIEIGAEVIVGRRSGTGCWRLAGRRSSFLACRPLLSGTACGFRPDCGRPRGRRLGGAFGGGSLCLSRGVFRLVEVQVFGDDDRFAGGFGPQIDAEQVFGQGFPGVFFATGSGARRICIH
ncbi:MAG TPA: hypothetical protein VHX68_06125, partial [Planctomycetaceae bacterium]|nr:hypothetical protein [Planctomycetaceae bacterium]